jgi:hypothetical protein
MVWSSAAAKRADQTTQQDVQRNRARDRGSTPTECLLERDDQDARRGTDTHRGKDHGEHDADDDPGVVDPARKQAGKPE